MFRAEGAKYDEFVNHSVPYNGCGGGGVKGGGGGEGCCVYVT